MMNVFQKQTCLNGGSHKFQNFLIKRIPPKMSQIGEVKTSVYGMEILLNKLTEEVYEIRCEYCGQVPPEKNDDSYS